MGALSALGDPARRRVYEHVAGQAAARSRATRPPRALGISRTLAAYHLDRLAADGLLTVAYERRSGRTGPGAGRPAKLYARAERELAVSVPPRDYGLAARLLADAAAADAHGETSPRAARRRGALGREIGRRAGTADLEPLLRARGYEPYEDETACCACATAPSTPRRRRHPDVVCDMNLALLEGLLDGLGHDPRRAVLEPGPGRCCVAIRRASG